MPRWHCFVLAKGFCAVFLVWRVVTYSSATPMTVVFLLGFLFLVLELCGISCDACGDVCEITCVRGVWDLALVYSSQIHVCM